MYDYLFRRYLSMFNIKLEDYQKILVASSHNFIFTIDQALEKIRKRREILWKQHLSRK